MRTLAIALLATSLLATGCGDSEKDPVRADALAAQPANGAEEDSVLADVVGAQPGKGADVDAKSTARNAASQLESCYVDHGSYEPCDNDGNAIDGQDTGVDLSTTEITVEADGWTVTTTSKSDNKFTLTKANGGRIERTCTTEGQALCPTGGNW
jgi:hypothetical protein